MLGASLLGQTKYADAEPLLKERYEGKEDYEAPNQPEKTMAPEARPRLMEALGKEKRNADRCWLGRRKMIV